MSALPPLAPPGQQPLTVSALNRLVRERLEASFPLAWVSGEISNLTAAASGHLYFSLKDESAQVRCVMWRNRAQLLGWRPENGQRVDARALVSFYEARGEFQLTVDGLRKTGQGDLFGRFLDTKARLEAAGVFDPAGKRPLPAFPRRIALVTSPQAAALQDVLTTFARRAPQVRLTLYPTPVQGDGAAASLARALAQTSRDDHDLILLCRGGGSLEDLWAFNEEVLARAIRASRWPVICGIGHETDFTIADFAADLRAPTPTAAAELAAPDRDTLAQRLSELHRYLGSHWRRQHAARQQRLDYFSLRLIHPAQQLVTQSLALGQLNRRLAGAQRAVIQEQGHRLALLGQRLQAARSTPAGRGQHLDTLARRLRQALAGELSACQARLTTAGAGLSALNPQSVLGRGYSLVTGPDGHIVRDARQLRRENVVSLRFAAGRAEALVRQVVPPNEEGFF